MTTKINLYNAEWCDLVFEGRNKEYGAYVLRVDQEKDTVTALFVTIVLFVTIALAFLLWPKNVVHPRTGNLDETRLISVELPDVKPVELLVYEPPKTVAPSIKFTPPVVVPDEVPEGESMATQESALNPNVLISSINRDGLLTNESVDVPMPASRITDDLDKPLSVVEQMPEFPGGADEMRNFLRKNLSFPAQAQIDGITGRVFLQFVVDKTGRISNIQVMRGIGSGCDQEAMRVIKMMPNWTPGKQNGRAVSVYFTLPINFTLGNQ